MKKAVFIVLAIVLAVSIVLVGCSKPTPTPDVFRSAQPQTEQRPRMDTMTFQLRLGVLALSGLAVACGRETKVDVEQVPVGSEVAVTRQDGGVVQGTLTERDPVTVKVDSGRAVRSVPREQIADVQVVKPEVAVVLPPVARFHEYTLPANTALSVRLDTSVSSATSKVEDPIEGTLMDWARALRKVIGPRNLPS